MDENTKLFIFDKKEIAIIFSIMLLLTLISFMLGVSVGKKFSIERVKVTHSDVQRVEFKSSEEEKNDQLIQESLSDSKNSVDMMEYSRKRAKSEIQDAAKNKSPKKKKDKVKTKVLFPQSSSTKKIDNYNPESKQAEKKKLDLSIYARPANTGQVKSMDSSQTIYTIQVGSYPSIEDAKLFADGFKERGYPAKIYKVNLSTNTTSGIYFRVSIGQFMTSKSAKEYIVKEKSLFRNTNYLIKKVNLDVTNFIN